MHHFDYRDGELHAEAVNLTTLARTVGTPFYCYSTATLERHYRVFAEAFADVKALICYAMKANSNQSVLKTFARLGAGADVVSGGELKRALAAGISPDKILFSGVGKTASELRMALEAGILSINVESESELELLSQMAANEGRTARISVRVNPDVDAKTHAKIATGKSENKFGVPLARAREVYARAAKLPNIPVTGVDMHIGSQITDLGPLGDAFKVLVDFVRRAARRRSHHLAYRFRRRPRHPLSRGREAPPDPKAYAEVVKRATKGLDCTLLFEPGRLLVGNAGILVTRVLYMKPGEAKNFVVIDAAMNDLVRPTLYEAHHDILPVKQPAPACADVRRRHRRPDLRERRLHGEGPRAARAEGRRPAGDHERRRLRRRAVRHLQHPRARARGAGEGRPLRRGAAACRGRGHHRARPRRAVAGEPVER